MCLWPVVQARTRTPDRSARLIGEITSAPQNPQRGTRPGTDSDDPQQIHKTYCTCHGDSRVEGMPDCVRSRETTPGHGVSQRGEIRCYTWTIRSADSTVEATSTVGEGQNVITRVCWISECPMGKRRSDRNQCDRKATAKPPSFRRPRRKETIDDDADDDRRDHHAPEGYVYALRNLRGVVLVSWGRCQLFQAPAPLYTRYSHTDGDDGG